MQVSIDNLSSLPAALEAQYNAFQNDLTKEYLIKSLGIRALVNMHCVNHDMGGRAFSGMTSTTTATATITPMNEEVKKAIQDFLSAKKVTPFGCSFEMEIFSSVKFN